MSGSTDARRLTATEIFYKPLLQLLQQVPNMNLMKHINMLVNPISQATNYDQTLS